MVHLRWQGGGVCQPVDRCECVCHTSISAVQAHRGKDGTAPYHPQQGWNTIPYIYETWHGGLGWRKMRRERASLFIMCSVLLNSTSIGSLLATCGSGPKDGGWRTRRLRGWERLKESMSGWWRPSAGFKLHPVFGTETLNKPLVNTVTEAFSKHYTLFWLPDQWHRLNQWCKIGVWLFVCLDQLWPRNCSGNKRHLKKDIFVLTVGHLWCTLQ